MNPNPVTVALHLYARFLEAGSAPNEGALDMARQLLAQIAMMHDEDRERYRRGARRLRLAAIEREQAR